MAVKKASGAWREIPGILLLAGAAIGLLSVLSYQPADIPLVREPPQDPPANFIGPLGAWFGYATFMIFGVAGYLVPVVFGGLGLLCLFRREHAIWPKAVWSAVLVISLGSAADLSPSAWEAVWVRLNIGNPGGVVGDLVGTRLLIGVMGPVGAGLLLSALIAAALILLLEIQPVVIAQHLWAWSKAGYERYRAWRKAHLDAQAQLESEAKEIERRRKRLERAISDKPVGADGGTAPEPAGAKPTAATADRKAAATGASPATPTPSTDKPRPTPPATPAAPAARPPEPAPEPAAARVIVPPAESPRPPPPAPAREEAEDGADKGDELLPPAPAPVFVLPSNELLDAIPPERERQIAADFSGGGQILKETLAEFDIEVDITSVERGPVVTRYEMLPAPGVRVEKITGLSNNIALAMKAESIRVLAPVPGKGVVGIEVPNPKTTIVYLRDIMTSDAWRASRAALPLALGQDVGGHVLVHDLAAMPHLLIAGATGSGKTVCMNSILAGLLMSRTPDQMRMILIDPKIVEFANFSHLPHLVAPVITEAKKVVHGLRWAITEMEKRYKMFARVGVRNIEMFNARPTQTELFAEPPPVDEPAEKEDEDEPVHVPDRLPYIVIVVDELADLMLQAQADIETAIARLAQLSRAVGIHMILATQRPSVDVITGIIKANFPARIAFQVASKIDSRTILDTVGAEKLLGKGDMLFLPPGSSKLIRAQGTLTTDAEITRVVKFIKQQGRPQYESAVKDRLEGRVVDLPDLEEDDELLEQAMEIIRQSRRASTSSLQRRLRIGYTRAARIMDLLEHRGIVGPAQGSDPREILIDLDGEVPANPGADEEK